MNQNTHNTLFSLKMNAYKIDFVAEIASERLHLVTNTTFVRLLLRVLTRMLVTNREANFSV